jgi:hypothetical protein
MTQIILDRKKGIATIDLNLFFYPLHLLQKAAASFANISEISIQRNGSRVILKIKPVGKGNAFEIALHFCNFALSLKRELGEHA